MLGEGRREAEKSEGSARVVGERNEEVSVGPLEQLAPSSTEITARGALSGESQTYRASSNSVKVVSAWEM